MNRVTDRSSEQNTFVISVVGDEPMARQISSVGNSSSISNMETGLKFGAILFDEKYGKNMEKFTSASLSSNILFRGVNCHKKREEKKERKYIFIGAMQVYVDDELPI